MFGVSIGLQRLIELAAFRTADDILDEVNAIDLFDSVFDEINVDGGSRDINQAAGAPPDQPDARG